MMQPDDLLSLKDDMIAFIEGHGMRRLPGYVGDDVPTVMWEDDANPDSWKDFVETAKAASAPFVTMSDVVLEKEDLELLLEPAGRIGEIVPALITAATANSLSGSLAQALAPLLTG